MALTRVQLRQQKILANYQAEMNRPPTRKQARAWVDPLRRAIASLLQGEVDTLKGHPIFEIKWAGNPVARIDHSLNGFVSIMRRMNPESKVEAIEHLAKRLTYGIMLTEEEVHAALSELAQTEHEIIKHTRKQLMDWVQTEQISCALQARGQA